MKILLSISLLIGLIFEISCSRLRYNHYPIQYDSYQSYAPYLQPYYVVYYQQPIFRYLPQPEPQPQPICRHEGYNRDLEDCTKFCKCVISDNSPNYKVFRFSCPSGLVFDQRLQTCNLPQNVAECREEIWNIKTKQPKGGSTTPAPPGEELQEEVEDVENEEDILKPGGPSGGSGSAPETAPEGSDSGDQTGNVGEKPQEENDGQTPENPGEEDFTQQVESIRADPTEKPPIKGPKPKPSTQGPSTQRPPVKGPKPTTTAAPSTSGSSTPRPPIKGSRPTRPPTDEPQVNEETSPSSSQKPPIKGSKPTTTRPPIKGSSTASPPIKGSRPPRPPRPSTPSGDGEQTESSTQGPIKGKPTRRTTTASTQASNRPPIKGPKSTTTTTAQPPVKGSSTTPKQPIKGSRPPTKGKPKPKLPSTPPSEHEVGENSE